MTDELGTAEIGTALPEERRLQIAAQLRRDSRVRVDDLAGQFGVSGETIRRDLQLLEERGLLRRVYGGAVVSPAGPVDALVEDVEPLGPIALAALAATLIEPGDTIVLHGDALMVELARVLPASYAGRVLCASLPVAAELAGRPGIDVLLAGGQLRAPALTCTGSVTERFFAEYFVDKVFLVVDGIHPTAGLTGADLADVAVTQVMMRQAGEVYVLADAARLGRRSVARISALSAVTAVVTDASADPDDIRALEQAGAKVLVAESGPVPD